MRSLLRAPPLDASVKPDASFFEGGVGKLATVVEIRLEFPAGQRFWHLLPRCVKRLLEIVRHTDQRREHERARSLQHADLPGLRFV